MDHVIQMILLVLEPFYSYLDSIIQELNLSFEEMSLYTHGFDNLLQDLEQFVQFQLHFQLLPKTNRYTLNTVGTLMSMIAL
jgi:hypothetical protein